MSKEMLKNLIELVPENDIDVLYRVIVKFIPEEKPEPDEIEALLEGRKDRNVHGTIYNLYNFDSKLREIFLKNILPLETNIRSLVAYYFPKNHPENHYLVYENFDTSKRDSERNIMSLLSDIHKQIASRISDPSISHYVKKYGWKN